MDPATMMMLASLGQSAIGSKQMGAVAPPPNLGGLLGQSLTMPQTGGLEGAMTPPASAMAEPDVPEWFRAGSTPQQPEQPSGFANFLGGIDKGLQSPSQVIGLGLLSRLTNQNPYAAVGGLLGMGLLNRER